jgi:acyl-CoA reductase-like NAD-dependent aldehyde dehydrogenase
MAFQHPEAAALPRFPNFIGGEAAEAGTGELLAHIYPGTGRVSRELRMASPADVDRAVAAARAAFPAWRAMPGDVRRNLMLKLADLLEARAADFLIPVIGENGTISMAAPYLPSTVAQKYRYFGGWADKIHGRTVPMWQGETHDYVSYEPFGVVGAIVPWNGPLFASSMCMAPALAAGNCIVLKAPELAPYSVMKLVELIHEAGFPAGVVNLVTGGPEVGDAMVAHPDIDMIQFIGSGATAKKILSRASETLKPCGLELGGKSAVIVFDDAELQRAAQRGLSGIVTVSGQGCVNGTRLLVQRTVYERYLELLANTAKHIPIGDPFESSTLVGPVISETAMNRIQGMTQRAVQSGARVVCGGERLQGPYEGGYFLPLTVLADVDSASELATTEVFGPVLAVTPFDTEEEAIALANDTEFGLGAYVHTRNLGRAHRVTRELQAGQIHVNGSHEAMQPNVPFGGWKRSGHGRLGGIEGLQAFLQPKNIWMNIADEQ